MSRNRTYEGGASGVSIMDALVSLRGKNPAALYVFAPGDDYFLPQARDAARSQVTKNALAFDYAEFDGCEENVDAILEFLETERFGTGRRVLVIDNLDEKTGKRFAASAGSFLKTGTSTLVFADPAKLPSAFLAKASVVVSYAVSPADTRSWVRKRLAGRAMDDRAMHELLERTAGSFFLMRNEIGKLLSYTKEALTVEDVRAVVPRCHAAAAEDLVRAISLRRMDRAAQAFEDLEASGAAGTAILFDVEQGFLRLLGAKLVARSVRPKADLRSWCQRVQHQFLDEYSISALLAAAKGIKLHELEKILRYLEDVEYQTKKGLISDPLTALRVLLSSMSLTTPVQ